MGTLHYLCRGGSCICNLSREEAEAQLTARSQALAQQILELPDAERLRVAADFLDRGLRKHAIATLRFALGEIERVEGEE